MLPRIVPTSVAALGAAAVAAGAVMLSVAAPATELGGTTSVDGVLVTAPGVLALTDQPVTAELSGSDSAAAFLGVGRPDEVDAWLQGMEHQRVDGLADQETLAVAAVTGDSPSADADPSAGSLWQEVSTGRGGTDLELAEPVPGDVLLAAVTPGGSGELTLSWERSARHPGAWPLVAGGAVVMVAAAMWLVALNARRRGQLRRRSS